MHLSIFFAGAVYLIAKNVFNRDKQLRSSLGTRYDSRTGAFDWDYNMKLIEKDPKLKIIHATEYKKWRETGMAFIEQESDYSQPNLTLTEGIFSKISKISACSWMIKF